MDVRHLPTQLRRAARLSPGWRFLWREVVVRRPVERSYRLRESGQTVVLRHRTPDLGGLTEIYVLGLYTLDADALRGVAEDRPLQAVDLGANIGLFGLRLLAARPDARIVAVEADPANAGVLRRTIAANGAADAWSVLEVVAATQEGTVNFAGGRYLESRVAAHGEPRPAIDVLPLLRDADVVKIDIEGAEGAILADPRLADVRAPLLFVEYHPPHTRAQVLAWLQAAGYEAAPFTERPGGNGDVTARRVAQGRAADR
jgi:FkbM family methyltransferase